MTGVVPTPWAFLDQRSIPPRRASREDGHVASAPCWICGHDSTCDHRSRAWRVTAKALEVVVDGRALHDKYRLGYRYLATILAAARTPIACKDLLRRQSGQRSVSPEAEGLVEVGTINKADKPIDGRALRDYKRALVGVWEKLDDANPEEREKLKKQERFLKAEIQKANGAGRRAPPDLEKANVAVSKAIREAIEKAKDLDKALGDYLDKRVRRRDNAWRFEPDENDPPWDVRDE